MRREELRRMQREALAKKGQLRSSPVGFMKQTVEKLNLRNILESANTKEKLSRAGYRVLVAADGANRVGVVMRLSASVEPAASAADSRAFYQRR